MDYELILTLGLLLGAFAIPSALLSASQGRSARVPAVLVILAGVMIVLGLGNVPGGLTWAEIPEVIFRVIARYIIWA